MRSAPEFCSNGHRLDADNLYVYPGDHNGKWYCRRCKRERYRVGGWIEDPGTLDPMDWE